MRSSDKLEQLVDGVIAFGWLVASLVTIGGLAIMFLMWLFDLR